MREGYKKTEIGVIPVEWEVHSLSDIGSFSKGKGIAKNEVLVDGFPCMRYAEIYTEYDTVLKSIKSFINEKSALNSKQILQGDILFAGSGETLDDIGKSVAFIDDFEAYVGGDTVILSPITTYNSLFMAYLLNSPLVRTQLRKLGQGSSVVHIYSTGLSKVNISFPPLKEQEKIADILSTADDKIEAIASQIQKEETLKKGLLQKLLSEGIGHSEFKDSELGRIPGGWGISKLDDMTILITKGTTPTSLGFKYQESGINFIKIESITKNGNFIIEKFAYISEKTNNALQRSIIKENDLLLSIAGALGRVAIVTKDVLPANTNQALSIIRLKDEYIKEYIYFYLNSSQIQNHIDKINVQNAQANLSLQNIKNFKILLPPIEEQKQIATILSTADEKLEVLRDKKEKYETLKQGLMQKLLTGEVRVK